MSLGARLTPFPKPTCPRRTCQLGFAQHLRLSEILPGRLPCTDRLLLLLWLLSLLQAQGFSGQPARWPLLLAGISVAGLGRLRFPAALGQAGHRGDSG